MLLSDVQLTHFRNQGWVIVQGIAPSLHDRLLAAAERTTTMARANRWPHARRHRADDIWGASNLLHPDLSERVFGEYLASPEVLHVAFDLLGTERIRLGLTNMLVNPVKADYAIAWHRDVVTPPARGDDELAMLNGMQYGVQWNAALCEESCLRIVPGTHRRNLTDAEWDVLVNRPMDSMPGELRVKLKAGEAVYYNAMLLHKGDYPASMRRLTLHANFVSMAEPKPFVGHYQWVKFMEEPSFRYTIPPTLWPLLDNWLMFAERCKAA